MMIDVQTFLPLAEAAGKIVFFDIEASGLKADYNSIICASFKPWHGKTTTFAVEQPGNDRTLVKQIRDELEKYTVWVGYYSKGFDIPMIRSRLLFHGMNDIEPKHHLDMYYSLKYNTLTARRSQAHLIEWLGTPNKKLTLSPSVWNNVLENPKRWLPTLRKRCEKDVAGLEGLYDRCRHLIKDLKR